MKRNEKLWSLLALLALTLCFVGCSSGSDGDEPEGGGKGDFTESDFGEVSSNSSFVSDFKMSDIDLLVVFAINCDLLDLEWIRFCSNDFKGDLMSGPGEYSDESFYLEVERDIMANADKYIDALNRLADDGICDNTTTRGLKDAVMTTGGWALNLITGARDTQNKLRAILRDMGAFSDKQMQEDIFSCLKEGSRGGYKDARSFFVALNSSETSYEMLLSANQQFAQIDQGIQEIERPGYQTHITWVNSRDKLKVKDRINRMVDAGKDLGNKAIKVEEAMVDVMTGGGYSTAQKADQWAKDTQETIKKVFNGKLDNITTEDVKDVGKKYTVDKLKELMPKTGNDNIDNALKFAADKLGEVALKKDPTGDAAKEKGKTILNIKNNTGENQKVIIVTGDDGKLSVVIPDKDGNGTSVTDPGNKKITAVTKDGKRSTKATSAKKDGGKQEEKIDPEPTGTPQIKAGVSKLPFTANPKDKEKSATFTVTTNCKYFGVKAEDNAKWLTLKKDTKAGTVTVTVTPNTDKEPRQAKIFIAGSNDKKTTVAKTEVVVTQEALKDGKLSVSSTIIEFDAEGGSSSTIITCEGYEKLAVEVASDSKEWLSASIKSTAAGSEIVSVTAKANTSFKRTGIITLRAGNADKLTKDNSEAVEITVEQAGAPIEKTVFEIEDWFLEFDAKGGTKSTKVTTNADEVTAKCNADWITVDVSKSSIRVKVAENKSTEKRSAEISVTAKRAVKTSETSGYTQEITETLDIYQDGTDAFGNEVLWGTWSYDNISLKLTSGGSFSYKSGSYSDSGSYKVTDFKCTAISGTDGYNISGTLYGIKNESWTFKTTYSKDGSGHYKKRQYCLTLTSKSSGSSIIVYKE